MKIHAVLVEMGLRMIHGACDLGDRHQVQADLLKDTFASLLGVARGLE